MSIKSRIFVTEAVANTSPRGKRADANYLIAYVQLEDGSLKPALFTDGDLQKALARAEKNPEDILPPHVEVEDKEVTVEQKGWLAKLFGG